MAERSIARRPAAHAAMNQRARVQTSITRAALAIVLAAIWLMPIVWTVSTSLRTPAQSFSLPPKWLPTDLYVANYRTVFATVPYGDMLLNSVKVSLAVVFGQLVTASMAGYAFARLRFPAKNVLFILLMASLMVPGQATIIPVFVLIRSLGIADSLWA